MILCALTVCIKQVERSADGEMNLHLRYQHLFRLEVFYFRIDVKLKKDNWCGKISVHEFGGEYHITLDMPRKPDEAGMFFIMEWLLKPWIGKLVEIDIHEIDECPPKKEPPKKEATTQEEWVREFRKRGLLV